jgi:hypothetical protein
LLEIRFSLPEHDYHAVVDRMDSPLKDAPMSDTSIIYPRSPRETMDGWVQLPRFIDKIRLHLAGQLGSDYQNNLTKGFDGAWLKASGVSPDTFIQVVKNSLTDGQVCDWVRTHVEKSVAEKKAFADHVLNHGRGNEELQAKLAMRKEQSGFSDRDDIQCFVDYIDADEGRI